MSTKVIVRVVPGGLMAVNGVESEKLEPLKGRQMEVTISQPRNLRFHRKFFALLGVARDMADTEFNAEQFRAYVTVGAGYCEYILTPISDRIHESDRSMIAIPKSIKFSSMDDTEFERLYQDVLSFICKTWVLDEKQINQILEFM